MNFISKYINSAGIKYYQSYLLYAIRNNYMHNLINIFSARYGRYKKYSCVLSAVAVVALKVEKKHMKHTNWRTRGVCQRYTVFYKWRVAAMRAFRVQDSVGHEGQSAPARPKIATARRPKNYGSHGISLECCHRATHLQHLNE